MTVGEPTVPLSVAILTFNEERNLAACLESLVGWVNEIFVVDSGSTDATVSIAERFGARVVTHAFDTHARQWAWALRELPIRNAWVLALDADQRVTPELAQAIADRLRAPKESQSAGYYLPRRQVFRGRWIRHGGYYPKYLLKLFRLDAVQLDAGDLVDHHFHVTGQVARLAGDLIEDNRNEAAIFEWIAKHNRYARLQAAEEVGRAGGGPPGRLLGTPDERTARMKRLWARLPLYARPFGYFIYRYFLRLGFLDGKEGLVFHFLQAFWYRMLVDINIDELRAAPRGQSGQMAAEIGHGGR
jgi:glycosyltransferase involved in cell wall biosynthesis